MAGSTGVHVFGLAGIPEIFPDSDLAGLILQAVETADTPLEPGDIVVVTHKIVSKSEGRLVALETVTPSQFAIDYATRFERDPRHIEVVLRESVRIVRMDHGVIIAETTHGLICANAGVDASNVAGDDVVCLLPHDPDASALGLRRALSSALGFDIAVIITDSFGRPWREGITNIAIGLSGLLPLTDYRGQEDDYGLQLKASILAVADEIAAASELVMGKLDRTPVAIVRGYPYTPGEGSGRDLIREAARDMFR